MNSLSDFLNQNFKVVLRKDGEEHCVNCIRCGDTKQHLYINIKKGLVHCFRCGYSDKVENWLFDDINLPWSQIKDIIQDNNNQRDIIQPIFLKNSLSFPAESKLLKDLKFSENDNWVSIKKWLDDNLIEEQDAFNYQFRYIQYGKYKNRIIIPCWDSFRRNLLYWIGRAINNQEPRYIYPKSPKSCIVWGLDSYKITDGYLYICEGWKDAYRVQGIALLGSSISEEQLQIIKILARKEGCNVRVLLDKDAWIKGYDIASKIDRHCKGTEVCFLQNLKDPGIGNSKQEVINDTVIFKMEKRLNPLKFLMQKNKKWYFQSYK